jgi:HEAT repeat protein
VPGLVEALRDEDGLVRRETAFALGWIRDEAAVPALLEALQDKDWRVRKAAAETLGSIGLPSLNGLLGALQDTSINVRRVAAEALGRIGHKAAVPSLLEALEDDSLDVRGAAIEALGWFRTPDSVERLIACLEDTSKPKWDTRRICDIAAEALQRIDTLEALTAVHEWRQRPASASNGSVTEGDESDVNITVNRLIQSLRDEDGLKRWSAVKALAAFKDTAGINALLHSSATKMFCVRCRF